LIQTSQRLGFPLGLSMVLTVGSAFDPQLGLSGYRYAFAAAAVLAAFGFGIALRFRNEGLRSSSNGRHPTRIRSESEERSNESIGGRSSSGFWVDAEPRGRL